MKPLSGKVTEKAHRTMRILGAEYDMNLGQVAEALSCFHVLLKKMKSPPETKDNINNMWTMAVNKTRSQNIKKAT